MSLPNIRSGYNGDVKGIEVEPWDLCTGVGNHKTGQNSKFGVFVPYDGRSMEP